MSKKIKFNDSYKSNALEYSVDVINDLLKSRGIKIDITFLEHYNGNDVISFEDSNDDGEFVWEIKVKEIWLVAPINYIWYNRCRNIMNRIKPISRIPNPVAKKLLDTRYRQRIVKNKKRYDRKREQNVYDRTV